MCFQEAFPWFLALCPSATCPYKAISKLAQSCGNFIDPWPQGQLPRDRSLFFMSDYRDRPAQDLCPLWGLSGIQKHIESPLTPEKKSEIALLGDIGLVRSLQNAFGQAVSSTSGNWVIVERERILGIFATV